MATRVWAAGYRPPIGGRIAGGPGWQGGGRPGWHGGGRPGWHGGGWRHYHRGYYPGFATGVGFGFGAPYYSSYYYAPSYYYEDDDDGEPVVAIQTDQRSVAYCMRRFKSYNPETGTYLGYDGRRHRRP
ncbi:MAG: BA14K family protein [Rhodopseudomonas palustris]|nr:BA14K family protein [Rhodopseudomonas palustris]